MKVAQIATIPTRKQTVKIAARSLADQVDLIRVFYDSDTDGNKFKNLKELSPDDVIFVCDDDIRYPPDYVETIIKYLKPGIVVTCMGKVLKPRPIVSFYRDELSCLKTFETCDELTQVEVGGTGVMAFYHTTCPDLDHTYFNFIGADVYMAKYCKENNIPIYVIPHKADWLVNLMPMLPADTFNVFDEFKNNDGKVTELINQFL